MSSNIFSPENDNGAYQYESWRWDESPQYAPTPGNFGRTPSWPSNLSLINSNSPSSFEYPAPQTSTSRTDELPLLQYGDWVEGKAYDENPPTCIHYWIEWKVTLNTKTVIKDTEQDLVLAPGFYWRLFLQPKLRELACYSQRQRRFQLCSRTHSQSYAEFVRVAGLSDLPASSINVGCSSGVGSVTCDVMFAARSSHRQHGPIMTPEVRLYNSTCNELRDACQTSTC